jgi:DNA (cytosine-5)-methyltransferase 3A
MSCGQIALERAGIKVDNYFASEIDKYAVNVTNKNYPNTVQLGDIFNWEQWEMPQIDLIIGGSPCTYWSVARKGRETTSEGIGFQLFKAYVDIVEKYKPKHFLYENNFRIHKNIQDEITRYLKVDPIMIDSALVSAQGRKRFYWTDIPNISQPVDKGILLKDIVLEDVLPVALHNVYGGFNESSVRVSENKSPTIRTAAGGGHIPSFVKKDLLHSERAIEYMNRKTSDGRDHWDFGHHSDIRNEKLATVVANFFKGVPYNVFKDWDCIRKFHPIECERLQTVPDNYTEGVSPAQRYKMIGNGWTVDVIAHIFSNIKINKEN